jgi:metacaspase-1
MQILRDDTPPNTPSYPSKANILHAMNRLVTEARPHDHLFFHFSGHGGQMVDFHSEQDDIYDETIYPADFQHSGQIINTVISFCVLL